MAITSGGGVNYNRISSSRVILLLSHKHADIVVVFRSKTHATLTSASTKTAAEPCGATRCTGTFHAGRFLFLEEKSHSYIINRNEKFKKKTHKSASRADAAELERVAPLPSSFDNAHDASVPYRFVAGDQKPVRSCSCWSSGGLNAAAGGNTRGFLFCAPAARPRAPPRTPLGANTCF